MCCRLTRLLWVALFLGALGLGCLYWYFGPGLGVSSGYDWLVPYVGAAMVLKGLVLAHTALYRVERLEVSRDGVRFACVKPGTELKDSGASFLTSGEIEEVGVRKNHWGRFRVTLSGDQQTARWGAYLSRPERKLVRDAIVETLAG